MTNKIKDFVRSLIINTSVAAYGLENKFTKNTDVENKSNTDGGIEIQKEHKNEVLNKLNRGEKHVEYVEYFYKLLELADNVKLTPDLFNKYKDNYNNDENFDYDLRDRWGNKKVIEEGEVNGYEEKFNTNVNFNNKNLYETRTLVEKLNKHYEFIKSYKHEYTSDFGENYESNIDFLPKQLTHYEYTLIDFVNFRKFNNNGGLVFEFWLKNDVSGLTGIENRINTLNTIEGFITYCYNKKNIYSIGKLLSTNMLNTHLVLTFGGTEIFE